MFRFTFNIEEIRKPDLDASLVAQSVARQLERRVMFRRAMKRVVQNAMRQGAQGIKFRLVVVLVVQRLHVPNGIVKGVFLCILYAQISIIRLMKRLTTYGIIGVKVWIFKGEVIGGVEEVEVQAKGKKKAQANK